MIDYLTSRDFLILLAKMITIFGGAMGALAYMSLIERRLMAFVQMRPGPNRVGPFGLLQPIADGLKFLLKEQVVPTSANVLLYYAAPIVSLVPALLSLTRRFQERTGIVVQLHHPIEGIAGLLLALDDVYEQGGGPRGRQGGGRGHRQDQAYVRGAPGGARVAFHADSFLGARQVPGWPTAPWQRTHSTPPAAAWAPSMASTISPWQPRQACSAIARLRGLMRSGSG